MAHSRTQRTYDHRPKEFVRHTRDPSIATNLGVPKSTAAGWQRAMPKRAVTAPEFGKERSSLVAEVARLRKSVRRLHGLIRVLVTTLRVAKVDVSQRRFPNAQDKTQLMRAIKCAQREMSLHKTLSVIGLSVSRYYSWRRAERACTLEDQDSCPKSSPQRLTPIEISNIKDMVTSSEFRHVPTGTLAVLAQRMGRVLASPSTCQRLVREHRCRRPRLRVHPAKPKVGIRATRPDETWHIDATIIRMLDGTKVYLHAVIDNFSRRILAWRLTERFDTGSTVRILQAAERQRVAKDLTPAVLVDGGFENMNGQVGALVEKGLTNRLLAQTDLKFSNSMIESWWRALKHQWSFSQALISTASRCARAPT